MNDAQVQPGSRVAVFGCGGLGLNGIQAAALSGAEIIIGVDLLDHRLKAAEEFGATHTVNPSKVSDPVQEIKDIARGGVDYAFEYVGSPKAAAQALEVCDANGRVLICGVMPQDFELPVPWWRVAMRGVSVKASGFGAARPRSDIPKYVNLYMAGKLKFDQLVTGQFKLSEINKAVEVMERGEGVRNLLYPD
jgi:S-(hydroxymethyl)glutathione dehydrogenase/alcohol dehydrogenase